MSLRGGVTVLLALALLACDGGGAGPNSGAARLPVAPDSAAAARSQAGGAGYEGTTRGPSVPADPVPVPPAYQGRTMPADTDVDAAALFAAACAPCHGETGRGDGPASVGLHPRPAAFAAPGFLAHRSDAYLFWRISEGKRATPMPAFKYQLSEEERWALVRYLRERWEMDGP